MPNCYEFELSFRLNEGENAEEYLDALFEAGCDDANVGFGKLGYVWLLFGRDAPTALEAVQSAIENVKSAIPHAELEEAGPDLINLTELAVILGTSKQNLQQYAGGQRSIVTPFVRPALYGKTNYWHSYDIIDWLTKQTSFVIKDNLLSCMKVVKGLNQAIELSKFQKDYTKAEVNKLRKLI